MQILNVKNLKKLALSSLCVAALAVFMTVFFLEANASTQPIKHPTLTRCADASNATTGFANDCTRGEGACRDRDCGPDEEQAVR